MGNSGKKPQKKYLNTGIKGLIKILNQKKPLIINSKQSKKDLNPEFKYILEIIRLRSLQAERKISRQKKIHYKYSTKNLFLKLKKLIFRSKLKKNFHLIKLLYILKPESTEFAKKYISFAGKERQPLSNDSQKLLENAKNWLNYKNGKITPSRFYKQAIEIKQTKNREFQARSHVFIKTKKVKTAIVGDSSCDLIAFHKNCKYDQVISIPGLRLTHINKKFIKLLKYKIFKRNNKNIQIDLLLGFVDSLRILHDKSKKEIKCILKSAKKVEKIIKADLNLRLHQDFFPINKNIFKNGSTNGIFPRNKDSKNQIIVLAKRVKNISQSSKKPVFQTIKFKKKMIKVCHFVHPNEIHLKINNLINRLIKIS